MSKAASLDDIERSVMRKVAWRIVPFLMVCYFVAFLDRVNAGFAALQMNNDIDLTSSAFGLGGGLFYVTYVLCETPSNLAMEKVGARLWIARILITWELVSVAMALVVGPWSFYFVRLLLGVAEAGFFPGIVLYLTYWFSREYRGRIVAIFMVAIPVSSFLGSPVSAAVLGTDGWIGLKGWQWMFVLEAGAAVALGLLTLVVLPSRPSEARFLRPVERDCLTKRIAQSTRGKPVAVAHGLSMWRVMASPYVLAASLIYAGASGASQCLSVWQPQIIKSFGLTNLETGFLSSIPFGIASLLMVLWGRHSDSTNERVWHTVIPLGLLALSLVLAPGVHSLAGIVSILRVAVTATCMVQGPFWALSTEWLSVGAAAAGIAQINAMGNIGGFLGTTLLGVIKDATGSYPMGLLPLAVLSGSGCILLLVMGRDGERPNAPEANRQPVRTG